MAYSFIQIKLQLGFFLFPPRLLISIKEWPLLCDLSDRLLPSIKCQSDCVESQSLFFKTDAKVLSEVPDHPKRTLEQRAHWPTGTVSLVTVAIKPDLGAQIHVECHCLYVCFVVHAHMRVCVRVRERVRNSECDFTLGSPVWLLAERHYDCICLKSGSGVSAPKSGAVMPFMLLLLLTSVLLMSLCCLTSDLYLLPPPLPLPLSTFPPRPCTLMSSAFPPRSLSPSPLFSTLLSSQGLPGRRALGVSSGRRGERERDHLQCESRNARPGAAVGEGTDGCPRPRLGARWEHILKLRLRWHNASLLGKKTCTNKLSYETPPFCAIYSKDVEITQAGVLAKNIDVDWRTHTTWAGLTSALTVCSWPAMLFIHIIFDWRHQFSPSHQPLSVYSVWFVWQHH